MRKNYKKYLLIFVVSLVIYWIAVPLRGGYVTIAGLTGHPLSLVVGSILYYLATLFFLKRYKSVIPQWATILTLILPGLLIEVPVEIAVETSAASIPNRVLILLSILLGWICFKIRPLGWKIAFSAVSLAAYLWVAYDGYDLWINKVNHGTFTGKMFEQAAGRSLEFRDETGAVVRLSDLSEDYVILDFWYSGCGLCIKAFPQVQELYEKYRLDDRVALYGVFCRRGDETFATGAEIISGRGHAFPGLMMEMSDPALKELGVDGYPTVLVFDRERDLVFRGDINLAARFMEKEL